MKVNQATHSVGKMCRVLGISRSGFYAWVERPMCLRKRFDLLLTGKIAAIHRRSRDTYGAPNIHAELADDHGIRVGRKRVARLMRTAGLKGATLRRYVVTTTSDSQAQKPMDLVERQFYAMAPDRLWVADITYIPTWAGFLYLAMVLDVYSRKIVGWAMDTHLKTELILQALEMAIVQRQPSGVIHHSDRGCQGDFQRSSQHLTKGGVVWDDHQGGLGRRQDGLQCGRRGGRASTSVR
ncbi:MAG: IS3 family transposase [Steroidobacteraceae bacterium]